MGLASSGTPATVAANSRRKKIANTATSERNPATRIRPQWIRAVPVIWPRRSGCRLDPILGPEHEILEGGHQLQRTEGAVPVATACSCNRTLHQPVGIAGGGHRRPVGDSIERGSNRIPV